MATRNLTKKFELLRTQARQRRPVSTVSDSLLHNNEDIQHIHITPQLPPEWVDIVDRIHNDINDIKANIKTLNSLHSERLKVKFDTSAIQQQDNDIDTLTSSITSKLKRCELNLKRIATIGDIRHLTPQERTTRLNVMRSIGNELKELSKKFQNSQKQFLHSRAQQENLGKDMGFVVDNKDSSKQMTLDEALDNGLTAEQLQQMNDLADRADTRYSEIVKIAQSINELASLFKELNVLVIEQGSVLDRIDYNIEQTVIKVDSGTKELEKAEEYSKKAYTMKCIVVLALIIVILLIILIWKHSSST